MGKPEIKRVRVADLTIDESYQRGASVVRVERMAARWRDDLAGAITVSERRDGRMVVADGQHRFLAARQAGVEWLWAVVHTGLSQADEATLFADINTATVRPTSLALFRARLLAGDPAAVTVVAALDASGVHIAYGGADAKRPRSTRSVVALEQVLRLGGADVLGETVRTCIAAWPDHPKSLEAMAVYGVGGFIALYSMHPDYQRGRLSTKLAERPITHFMQRAQSITEGAASATGGMSSAIKRGPILATLEAYNRGLRGKHLPEYTMAESRRASSRMNPWEAS